MEKNNKRTKMNQEKILLVLLPFWTPLIPPIGISCIKTFLSRYDFNIRTVDATVERSFKKIYEHYFDLFMKNVPEKKRGNFYSIGHDVLRNHMMAYLNRENEQEYIKLVKTLIAKTFYTDADNALISGLNSIISEFYITLEKYVMQLMESEKPSILGLSVFSDNLPASIFTFKLVKRTNPHLKTVMGGGVFADLLSPGSENLKIFLEKTGDYIDKIVVGEGEILFRKWLDGELPPGQKIYTLEDIDRQILDLSKVDVPDLSDFEMENYPYLVSYSSRSCPFQCSFCSETVQWGKYRKKNPARVTAELHEMYQKYKYQLFLFSDSLLNPVIEELAVEFLKLDVPLYWSGWLRVDKHTTDIKKTIFWRKSGFYHARLGIESGSQDVLDIMNKKITVADAVKSIESLANAGIKTTTLWIIGHPGEREEDFQQTLDFLTELKDEIYEAECRPFYFYLTGQVNSNDDYWGKINKIPLYPKSAENMLLFQTWLLDTEPNRKITYERMNRFVAHCKELNIPNPYSMVEIYKADERWDKLHKNAVPSLVEFRTTKTLLNECRNIENLNYANINQPGNIKFNF